MTTQTLDPRTLNDEQQGRILKIINGIILYKNSHHELRIKKTNDEINITETETTHMHDVDMDEVLDKLRITLSDRDRDIHQLKHLVEVLRTDGNAEKSAELQKLVDELEQQT